MPKILLMRQLNHSSMPVVNVSVLFIFTWRVTERDGLLAAHLKSCRKVERANPDEGA